MTKKEENETKGSSGIYSKLYKYYNISILNESIIGKIRENRRGDKENGKYDAIT